MQTLSPKAVEGILEKHLSHTCDYQASVRNAVGPLGPLYDLKVEKPGEQGEGQESASTRFSHFFSCLCTLPILPQWLHGRQLQLEGLHSIYWGRT